jgi:hypothetical protein
VYGHGQFSFMVDGKEVPLAVSPDNGVSAATAHSMPGHLGNLTAQQELAFSTFKENLIKANLYTPNSDNHEASHDDPTLLCVCLPSSQYPMYLIYLLQSFFESQGF